jgi:hypothetical protein
LLDPENIGFLATYTVVGGAFAGLIFVSSVIAIPMIMDRQVGRGVCRADQHPRMRTKPRGDAVVGAP